MYWNYAIFRTHTPRGDAIDIPFVIPGDSTGKIGLHGLLITGAHMHNLAGRHATEKQVICEACNHYNGSHYEVQRLLPYQAPHTILKRVLHNHAKSEWYFSEKLRAGNATTFSYNKILPPASVAFDNAQAAQRNLQPNNNMATCKVQEPRTVNLGFPQASQRPSNAVFPWMADAPNNENPGFRNPQAELVLRSNPTPANDMSPSEQNRAEKGNSQALKQGGQEKKSIDTPWEEFSPPNSPPPPPPALPDDERPNSEDSPEVNNGAQNIEPYNQPKSTTIQQISNQQEPNQTDTRRNESENTPRNPETPAQCHSNEKVAGSGGKKSSDKEKTSSKGECSQQIQNPEERINSESEKRGREESESDADERKLLNAAIKSLQKRLKKAEAELFQAKKVSEDIESKATHNEGLQEKLDLLSEENKLRSKQIKAVKTQIKSFDERKQKLIAVLETPT